MPSYDFFKYPRLKKLIDETGMTPDQAYMYVENECRKRGLL